MSKKSARKTKNFKTRFYEYGIEGVYDASEEQNELIGKARQLSQEEKREADWKLG